MSSYDHDILTTRAGGAGAAGAARAAPLLNSNIISSMGRGSAERPKYYYLTYNGRPTFHGLPTPLLTTL